MGCSFTLHPAPCTLCPVTCNDKDMIRRICDLHAHSTASDGSSTPAELVQLADRQKLGGLALTDHDTVDGIAEAAAEAEKFAELEFVPGVELSAAPPQGVLHILGLDFDPQAKSLHDLINKLLIARNERNPQMVDKLQALGVKISMDEVRAAAEPSPVGPEPVLGRGHMAAVLIAKGYAGDMDDAFKRYLGERSPAYVDKEKLTPHQVADAIHGAGGVAIIAHPIQLRFRNFAEGERLIRLLVDQGMDGLEAYHSDHNDLLTRFFLDLARKFHLAISGGSDFHGAIKPHVQLGRPRVPIDVMNNLLSRRP